MEHITGETPVPESYPELVDIGEGVVQREVIQLWSEEQHFDDRNAAATAWVTEGLAEKYRSYVKDHPGLQVNPRDKNELQALLDDFLESIPLQ